MEDIVGESGHWSSIINNNFTLVFLLHDRLANTVATQKSVTSLSEFESIVTFLSQLFHLPYNGVVQKDKFDDHQIDGINHFDNENGAADSKWELQMKYTHYQYLQEQQLHLGLVVNVIESIGSAGIIRYADQTNKKGNNHQNGILLHYLSFSIALGMEMFKHFSQDSVVSTSFQCIDTLLSMTLLLPKSTEKIDRMQNTNVVMRNSTLQAERLLKTKIWGQLLKFMLVVVGDRVSVNNIMLPLFSTVLVASQLHPQTLGLVVAKSSKFKAAITKMNPTNEFVVWLYGIAVLEATKDMLQQQRKAERKKSRPKRKPVVVAKKSDSTLNWDDDDDNDADQEQPKQEQQLEQQQEKRRDPKSQKHEVNLELQYPVVSELQLEATKRLQSLIANAYESKMHLLVLKKFLVQLQFVVTMQKVFLGHTKRHVFGTKTTLIDKCITLKQTLESLAQSFKANKKVLEDSKLSSHVAACVKILKELIRVAPGKTD